MTRQISSLLVCLSLALTCTELLAQGQLRRPERLGLTKVWSKAIPTGLGGKISGVHLHLSKKSSYNATDIVDRFGRRQFFSGLDTKGVSRGGYDPLDRSTELTKARLQAQGLDPRVESQSIPRATLYVRGTSGMVTAINAETGRVLWATQAGKPGYPSHSVAASDEYVVALSSTKMYLLEADSGRILDSVSTRSIPSGTPTLDIGLAGEEEQYVYVPTWRGLIEVYSTEDFGPVEFTVGSTSPVTGTVTLAPESIGWATDKGDLYVANRSRPGIKFRFESPDTISAAPAYFDGVFYASSLDGFVYAIDAIRGDVKWRYSAGGPIDVSPLAVDGMVFATTRDGQLVCLIAESGEVKWTAYGVERFLSATTDRLYYATTGNQLAVIDTATGAQIGSAPMGTAAVPFVNTATDRLYLATDDGVLTCLREAGRRWPLVRESNVDPVPPETTTVDASEGADEAMMDASPTADNEVPDDIGDFGGEDAAPADQDPAADEEDPFGAFDDFGGGDDGMGDNTGAEEDPFNDF